ncbi:hypothetical protein DH2020_020948 [Rehmannia glutinosa]|uniref:Carboxypeptidase n=1 Tax=Rehmannia glutinosa TaxID=99300 RepID=A0ABR0W8Z2_REHGL
MQADKSLSCQASLIMWILISIAGYVTVDPTAGRALFYYLNSLDEFFHQSSGFCGSMEVQGVHLLDSEPWRNWVLQMANVLFLESPAGVGFSYSNTTADYNNTGDTTTANDAYTFLVNWLERFPQYKARDFYITGESYAGHYVPQLAYTILLNNKNTNQTVINLKGIATRLRDVFKFCDFVNGTASDQCQSSVEKSINELGMIDINNMYAPICLNPVLKTGSTGSVNFFDPCSDAYVEHYLNTAEVQSALHVKPTTWQGCSGDIDANVPVTATRYAINSLKLPVETSWRPWYFENEVGGYVVGYKGLTFVTVRGAGHLVPSYQPQRALAMVSSFLEGTLPQSSQ